MSWLNIPTLRAQRPHPNAKLTAVQIREIRKLLADGVPHKVIAIDFGISSSLLSDIKYYRKYKGII